MKVMSYRLWVYLFNAILILLELLFTHMFWLVWIEPRLQLFPLDRVEVLVAFTLISTFLQLLTCLCGIFGVCFLNYFMLRLYWLLMLPQIIFDTVQIVSWAYAFACLHADYKSELSRLIESQLIENRYNNEFQDSACQQWFLMQAEFSCCAPSIILHNCRNLTSKCGIDSTADCHFSLLRWLHSNMDSLAILLYFIIYPIKWIAVCVLRDDIHEVFSEIFYTKNPDLYRHWLVIEQQESDDSRLSTQLSSPNQFSMISESKHDSLI